MATAALLLLLNIMYMFLPDMVQFNACRNVGKKVEKLEFKVLVLKNKRKRELFSDFFCIGYSKLN